MSSPLKSLVVHCQCSAPVAYRELGTVGGVMFRLAKRNNNTRGRRNRNRQVRGRTTQFPPQLQASIQIDKVIRFKATAALTAAPILDLDLVDLFCMATAANAAYRLPVAAKLRRIEAWAPPSSTGAAVVLAVEDVGTDPAGGFSGPSRRIEDVTMGQSRPAHVVFTPSPQSITSKWVDGAGTLNLVQLTGPADTTFDVHLSWTLQDGEVPAAVSGAVAGATVGTVYVRALNSNGANNIPPVSYTTI